ncbi:hypothetical protein BDK51DRAFT_53207 [Blyttiomyces helicus]|uniref:Uncharacterized protein n=1 Tax=Blyttiomyces helicus TaxID=388810 RepID=A0A4V1IQF1_9FUNG|nr:hypothetical protein BDK51DRAFT_53207 [Blyttiomyces helicus]|eukprot:RKO86337.1 hypothetical protein BDK51DRAFT_53207 [Blyttiomyces helicus]
MPLVRVMPSFALQSSLKVAFYRAAVKRSERGNTRSLGSVFTAAAPAGKCTERMILFPSRSGCQANRESHSKPQTPSCENPRWLTTPSPISDTAAARGNSSRGPTAAPAAEDQEHSTRGPGAALPAVPRNTAALGPEAAAPEADMRTADAGGRARTAAAAAAAVAVAVAGEERRERRRELKVRSAVAARTSAAAAGGVEAAEAVGAGIAAAGGRVGPARAAVAVGVAYRWVAAAETGVAAAGLAEEGAPGEAGAVAVVGGAAVFAGEGEVLWSGRWGMVRAGPMPLLQRPGGTRLGGNTRQSARPRECTAP